MMNFDIINKFKLEINNLHCNKKPIIIFIGGIPGSGKSFLIEKVKKKYKNRDFAIIEADLYRKYLKIDKDVESTVMDANFIEDILLQYALEHNKNIISISTLRNFEYINNIIKNNQNYRIFFNILLTNEIESYISAYERYIIDKENKDEFARLTKYSYLDLINNTFVNGIKKFYNEGYFPKMSFFVRGKNIESFPRKIIINKENVINDIEQEIINQKKKIDIINLKKRIEIIKSKLSLPYEKKEFKKLCDNIIYPEIIDSNNISRN